MHIFKHCHLLEEVHLSHNWLTEKSCVLMVEHAGKHLPKECTRPLWLRMEHNCYKDHADIMHRCKQSWCEASVCFREDDENGRKCTNRWCKNNARIHLPFMLDDGKDRWKQNGKSWSPWRNGGYGYRYKDDHGDYGNRGYNGYNGGSYGNNGYGGKGRDSNGYDNRGYYQKSTTYGGYGNHDAMESWQGNTHHRANGYGYGRSHNDRTRGFEDTGREGRWRDSRSRSRTPPTRGVRLRERFSPPRARAPAMRVPSPPQRLRRQAAPARRTVQALPRKAPTPPRPRRQPRQPIRRPITPDPVPNYQRNRQAPQPPLPRNLGSLGNLAQVRRPPSPPARHPKPLQKQPEAELSSSYEYYSDDDEYSYDDDDDGPAPQGQTRDVKSVVVPLSKGFPKGSVGQVLPVQKHQFQSKGAYTQRREPLAKGRPFQQNRRR